MLRCSEDDIWIAGPRQDLEYFSYVLLCAPSCDFQDVIYESSWICDSFESYRSLRFCRHSSELEEFFRESKISCCIPVHNLKITRFWCFVSDFLLSLGIFQVRGWNPRLSVVATYIRLLTFGIICLSFPEFLILSVACNASFTERRSDFEKEVKISMTTLV